MPTVQKATMPTLVCGMARVELSGLEKVRSLLRADCCSEARQQAKARDGQEDPIPRHLHVGGGGAENQLAWVQGTGKV